MATLVGSRPVPPLPEAPVCSRIMAVHVYVRMHPCIMWLALWDVCREALQPVEHPEAHRQGKQSEARVPGRQWPGRDECATSASRRGLQAAAGVSSDPAQGDRLERVHTALAKSVNKATKKIADQEKDWDQVELCKRIVRYLYKGAQAPELLTLHWRQAAEQFVDTAMQGFTAACGDKPWFFEMDLTSAFGMAFWEIHSGSGQRAQWSEVEAVLNSKYEQLMDLCLLEKAMWDSAGGLIPDQEPLRNKLYKALKTSHEIAFKEATEAPRMGDLQRVELFTRAWVDSAINKSYSVLEQGNLMNADSVVQLFQELLAPFGEEHPFSCIPAVLTQSIGRPPKDWDFLQEAVRQFFLLWNNPENGADAGYGQRRSLGSP
ncbi:unnamed protein product [Symbiodinium sp. CCMP2592]|nr:unnamed protein product [Symbiodinium sp. CCMP2592]